MVVNMLIGNRQIRYKKKHAGFTYIGVLMLVAISGIGLAGTGVVWHQDAQREREKELLFIGEEFRHAIGSYYESTPDSAKQYPKKMEDLLLDDRFPVIKRHLRKLYTDPFSVDADWGLVTQQGQIVGVYSVSELSPIKTTGFLPQYEVFGSAKKYSEWKFTYTPG